MPFFWSFANYRDVYYYYIVDARACDQDALGMGLSGFGSGASGSGDESEKRASIRIFAIA